MLVDDSVDVASPVLMRSPLLTTQNLVEIVGSGRRDHQLLVARRPGIAAPVSDALVRTDFDAVLDALLRNTTAEIGKETFANLVERSRDREILPALLAQRNDLPPDLAQRMCSWVSAELKQALVQRFPDAAGTLTRALDEASTAVQTGVQSSSEMSAAKLVAKLSASGQLRSSFLIRVLHQGQMDLFDHGFAALLDLDLEATRNILYGERPVLVAYACRGIGIDRAVFGTVFNLSRHHKRLKTALSSAEQTEVERIFTKVPKTEALERVREMVLS